MSRGKCQQTPHFLLLSGVDSALCSLAGWLPVSLQCGAGYLFTCLARALIVGSLVETGSGMLGLPQGMQGIKRETEQEGVTERRK